jgi:microcystin-dependent protein
MTYNIDWKSANAESIPGKAPIILAERTVDTTSTSLALTGKGTANYGEMQQENFIRLLENFASNTAPPNPTVGQLWFHPVDKALYLCVQTSTVVANTAVYYQSGVIGWVRVWESTELGTIVEYLEQSIIDAITAHINAADPHPQYLTLAEGNLQYLQKTGGTLTGPLVLPSDASTALQAVPKQQLDAALTVHTNAADPHPQYLTQTEADGRYSLGTGTVNLTGDQTIAGTKTFSSTITGSVSGNAGTVTNGVYASGDQTIGGVKTFSASPIAPTPDASDNSTKLATTAFVNGSFDSLKARLDARIGSLFYHAAATAPANALKCNGAAVSRTTYAALFAVIGTTYGAGNGSTTFNLPELRGEFIRSLDDGRGVDAGRGIGTAQGDEFKSHTHGVPDADQNAGFGGNAFDSGGNTAFQVVSTTATGGTETRPRNVSALACIWFA